MLIRKFAILPAILVALGLTIGVPAQSFAATDGTSASTTKKKKKSAKKKTAKKKAADISQVRSFA